MLRRGCVDEAATISGCQGAGCQGCHWTAIQAMCWLIRVRSEMIKCRNVREDEFKLTAVCYGQRLSYTEGCKEGRSESQ